MDCDYCGLATGVPARWEVTSGAPGVGMTRYPCDAHLPAAFRKIAEVCAVGEVQVFELNAAYLDRRAAA